jgi:hypothetical protein
MARRKAMKSRLAIFWAIAIAVVLLAMPAALAKQGQSQRHYQRGDIWVGCVANAPATTWEKAFFEAASIGEKEARSCWVDRRTGWWVFCKTKKTSVITLKKRPER